MNNIITRLDKVEIFLDHDIGYIRLRGLFLYGRGEQVSSLHDSWTKSYNNDQILPEKEFLYHLLFETGLISTIYSFDLNLLEFLEKCSCLNENDIDAILMVLKIDKL